MIISRQLIQAGCKGYAQLEIVELCPNSFNPEDGKSMFL
jgi:hypothetical protein